MAFERTLYDLEIGNTTPNKQTTLERLSCHYVPQDPTQTNTTDCGHQVQLPDGVRLTRFDVVGGDVIDTADVRDESRKTCFEGNAPTGLTTLADLVSTGIHGRFSFESGCG